MPSISRIHDMVKNLTDFDVFPFRWSCRYCSRPYPLEDFFDAKDIYKHFESPLLIADLRKIAILVLPTGNQSRCIWVWEGGNHAIPYIEVTSARTAREKHALRFPEISGFYNFKVHCLDDFGNVYEGSFPKWSVLGIEFPRRVLAYIDLGIIPDNKLYSPFTALGA